LSVSRQIRFLVAKMASASELCYGYHIMKATVKMDNAGRIKLLKSVREKLQLSTGDSLQLELSEDRIVLRPARVKARLYKKKGIWVLHTGAPMPVNVVKETIHKIREEREQKFLGKKR